MNQMKYYEVLKPVSVYLDLSSSIFNIELKAVASARDIDKYQDYHHYKVGDIMIINS
jgi:hypothetical protein